MQDWISVKDKIPEEHYSNRFLAYGIPVCGTCAPDLQIQFCRYYEDHFEYGEYDCVFEATHWMKLPNPPGR